MQDGQVMWLADQLSVEVEEVIQTARSLGVVNRAGHEEVSRVMIALRLDEAGVEGGEFRVVRRECASEDLKLLAAPAFDECATDEVVNDLHPHAFAHRVHETGNPRAGVRLGEGDAAPLEQREHELELAAFYASLVESEGNHYATYLLMARAIDDAETSRRLDYFLDLDAELISKPHGLLILH